MIVESVENEPFTYNVKSRSTPGHHRIFLPDSECSCIGWTTRAKKYQQITGKRYKCAHIKACWLQLEEDIHAKFGTK